MNRAVIGIGSNIKPYKNIEAAKKRIANQFAIVAESKIIKTKPIGFLNQPDFLNGVILVETPLDRKEVKYFLREIETQLHRIRTENKYGPRTIDLDILVWNETVVDEDVYNRQFLKQAIREILPEFKF